VRDGLADLPSSGRPAALGIVGVKFFSHRRIILMVAGAVVAVLAAIVFNTIPASRLTSHLK
jgi:hypothetical protein